MNITFSDELIAYRDKKGLTELTVTAVKTSSTCCKIIVPKVIVGKPRKTKTTYTMHEAYGVQIFIDDKLKLTDEVHFTYNKLLMREMIECQGFVVERSAAWF